jgi:hypothetical protein
MWISGGTHLLPARSCSPAIRDGDIPLGAWHDGFVRTTSFAAVDAAALP